MSDQRRPPKPFEPVPYDDALPLRPAPVHIRPASPPTLSDIFELRDIAVASRIARILDEELAPKPLDTPLGR